MDAPEISELVERKWKCRFCGAGYMMNKTRKRHERSCNAPKGPKHKCVVGECEDDCPGPREYVADIDRRRFNGRGRNPVLRN